MAKYTMTINQILKSLHPDNLTFRTEEDFYNGDYLSPNKIIEDTKEVFFSKMKLNKYVNSDFKTQFLLRFYNEEIAFETVTPFFTRLETILNSDVLMQLKLADELRNAEIEKLLSQNDLQTKSVSDGNNSNIGLVETTPEDDLNILFNKDGKDFSLIKYANEIQEQHAKIDGSTSSTIKGFSGGNSYYILLQAILQFTDPYEQIFNECERRLFMQVY